MATWVLDPSNRARAFLLLTADDPHYRDNCYTEAIEGTGWENKVILGVAGAEKQVRFADSICPKGSHVVIVDDNIKDFIKGIIVADGSVKIVSAEEGDLSKLIERAGNTMTSSGFNAFTLVTTLKMNLF